jgi:hypothetical protein
VVGLRFPSHNCPVGFGHPSQGSLFAESDALEMAAMTAFPTISGGHGDGVIVPKWRKDRERNSDWPGRTRSKCHSFPGWWRLAPKQYARRKTVLTCITSPGGSPHRGGGKWLPPGLCRPALPFHDRLYRPPQGSTQGGGRPGVLP